MLEPHSSYEIELKALLTQAQYQRLQSQLPGMMQMVNEEQIHTTRYRPGDIRLRHSDKTLEIICKEGSPTTLCRKEVRIPLLSREYLIHFDQVFTMLNMKPDPPWVKDKREFEYPIGDHTYIVCLQHIHNFAYILEVEFMDTIDSSSIHEPRLRSIISELGCEPINPEEFSERIKEYIDSNNMAT